MIARHRSLSVLAASLATLAGIAACSVNSATGRRQFNAMSRDEEIQTGTQASTEMVKESGGKVTDPNLQAYVTEVGKKLATKTEGDNPSLPWEFTLLDTDIVNAFALPGGKVFLTRGLAAKMTNEAEMAGVLGHECGHVTARHINDQMVRETGTSLLLTGTKAVLGASTKDGGQFIGPVLDFGGQTVLLKFSRNQESEADSLGLRYMSRCGYNPKAQRMVMEILQQLSASGQEPELLSTHPYPETRIERIDKELGSTYASMVNDPAYKLFEAEYQSRMLKPLAAYHPARPPKAKGNKNGNSLRSSLDHPEEWCAICAFEAQLASAPEAPR